MDALFWAGIAVAAGGLFALQSPSNAMLARALTSPLAATFVSVSVSALAAAAVLALSGQSVQWRAAPIWLYGLGGVLGVIVVLAGIMVTPRLGVAVFIGCLLLGQLTVGLVLDHIGAFGSDPHPLSLGRVGGLALILSGVALFRLF